MKSFKAVGIAALCGFALGSMLILGCPGKNGPENPKAPNGQTPSPTATPPASPSPTATATAVSGIVWYEAQFGNNGSGIEAMVYVQVNGQAVLDAAVSLSGAFAGSPVSLSNCGAATLSGNPFAFYCLSMAPSDYLPGTHYLFSVTYGSHTSTVSGAAPGGNPVFAADSNGGVTQISWDVAGNNSLVYLDTYPGYTPVYFQSGITTASFPIPVSAYGGEAAGTGFYIDATAENDYSAVTNGTLDPNGYIRLKRDYPMTVVF